LANAPWQSAVHGLQKQLSLCKIHRIVSALGLFEYLLYSEICESTLSQKIQRISLLITKALAAGFPWLKFSLLIACAQRPQLSVAKFINLLGQCRKWFILALVKLVWVVKIMAGELWNYCTGKL
jgi:hypothetical protein